MTKGKTARPWLQLSAVLYLKIQEPPEALLEEQTDAFFIDSFQFCVNVRSIPIDFNAYAVTVLEESQDKCFRILLLQCVSGDGPYFSEYQTSEIYDAFWAEDGLLPEDITAEFLSHADCVEEVSLSYGKEACDIYEFAIRELKLYDGRKEYVLPENSIQHANLQINPMYEGV